MSLGSGLKSIMWYYYIWANFTREISQEESDPYILVFSFTITHTVIHLEISIVKIVSPAVRISAMCHTIQRNFVVSFKI